MPEAIIRVGKINDPGPGKKRFKIIGFNNETFQVNADLVHLFTLGRSYKVFYEDQEYLERKFRVIMRAPEEVPEISTGSPQGTASYSRPRAAKEDEDQVNKRHRLTWIGERLDALCPGKPLTYKDLHPIVELLGRLYDAIAFGVVDGESVSDPRLTEYPLGYKTPPLPQRAASYKPGQFAKDDPELDDDIPY